jgi:Family of unknown function (DUF5309)
MAVPAGTTQTFQMVGIREQLSDVIINIAPKDTPFTSMVGKTTAMTRTPEWLRDTLANPNPVNAQIEGNDATNLTAVDPDRIKNITQLFDKTIQVSSTAQVVKAAGRSNEMKYQIAKRGHEIKRDMEMRFCSGYASVIGNATTAGQMAGYESWIVTNASRGTGGAAGGYNSGTGLVAAPTDGTLRAFTEALLKNVIQSAYNNGSVPEYVMMRATHKQTASTFGGIATQYRPNDGVKVATILGAAGVYISDFGEHKLIANRFVGAAAGRTADGPTGLYTGNAGASAGAVLLVEPSKWKIAFLQPFKTVPLAKTGHADRRMLFAEMTLECLEERASAVISDLL